MFANQKYKNNLTSFFPPIIINFLSVISYGILVKFLLLQFPLFYYIFLYTTKWNPLPEKRFHFVIQYFLAFFYREVILINFSEPVIEIPQRFGAVVS